MRGGLGETGVDRRRPASRAAHSTCTCDGEPALLADRRPLDTSSTPSLRAQRVEPERRAPPRSGRRPRSRSRATCSSIRAPPRLLEGQDAQDVGHARAARGAKADAGRGEPPGPGGRPRLRQRWRRIAAPVGVTRSPSMPSSITAKPCSSSAVAGAGTGSRPWLLAIRPRPSGSGAVDQLAPSALDQQAAPTMSAIEVPVARARGNAPARSAGRAPWPRPRRAGPGSPARAPARRARVGAFAIRSRMLDIHAVTARARRRPADRSRPACRSARRRGERDARPASPRAGRPRASPRRRPSRAPARHRAWRATNMSPAMPPSGSRWMWASPMRGLRPPHDDGHHIRALGDQGDAAVARASRCCRAPRRSTDATMSTPGQRVLRRRQAAGVELDPADAASASAASAVCHSSMSAKRLAPMLVQKRSAPQLDEPALRLDGTLPSPCPPSIPRR